MPYDPSKPATGSPLIAAEMRAQLSGLHELIPQSATVDTTLTVSSGSPAAATVTLSGSTLHFTFEIPQGPPGEVTQAQLSNDLVNCQNAAVNTVLPLTSANSNGVMDLPLSISDPPTQAEVQSVLNKLNELIFALRR